jgi:coproporphyrinogen III oxidase
MRHNLKPTFEHNLRKPTTSKRAIDALTMLSKAQDYFVKELSQLCLQKQLPGQFTPKEWLRDNGLHGGGLRFEAPQNSLFNKASVNVSQIQYEDRPGKAIISATALSTIIHPLNPLAPSVHIHVSWTELRSGKSYWRLMADLNPAIACEKDTAQFNNTLKLHGKQYFEQAKKAGDEYFYIPALQTHRGVSHFYLEGFNPDGEQGIEFADNFLLGVIDSYITILNNKLTSSKISNKKVLTAEIQKQTQLDYHTLYFYQVLTLDKGTTAGLLMHDQNDVGTLSSLPRFINRNKLLKWAEKTPSPRDKLVKALVTVLTTDCNNNESSVFNRECEVSTEVKINIAQVIRTHYKNYPL